MVKRLEDKLHFDEMYDLSITDFRKGIYTLEHHAKKALNRLGRFVKRGGATATLVLATTLGSTLLGACQNLYLPTDPTKNSPPVISGLQNGTGNENTPYNQKITISDADGDKITTSISPSWLSINNSGSNTWTISGTYPSVNSDTNYTVEIDVSDGINPLVKATETLTDKYVPGNPTVDFSSVANQLGNMNEEQTLSNIQLPTTDSNGKPVAYQDTSGDTTQIHFNVSGGKLNVTGKPNETESYQFQLPYNDNGQSTSTTLNGYLYNLLDVSGQIQDLAHNSISGILQIFDTSGSIPLEKILMITGNASTASNGKIIIQTDSNGNFNFRVNERADPNAPLSSFKIEAGGGSYVVTDPNRIRHDNSAHDTYLRKIQLANLTRDITSSSDPRMNPAIRASPYVDINGDGIIGMYTNYSTGSNGIANPQSANEIDDFVTHKNETNGTNLTKYDGIQKIDVLSQNPGSHSSIDIFSSSDKDIINQVAMDYINTLPADERLTIEFDNSNDYFLDNAGFPAPNPGVLLIAPDKSASYPLLNLSGELGECFPYSSINYTVQRAQIYLQNVFTGIVEHEMGHGLFSPYHATTLGYLIGGEINDGYNNNTPGNYTIMTPLVNSPMTNLKDPDKEDYLEAHESTYQREETTDETNGISF